MNTAIDFQSFLAQKDVDSRIKASKEEMVHIMQSEHRALQSEHRALQAEHRNLENSIIALDKKIDKVELNLNARIDKVEQNLNARIDKLETRIDKVDERIDKVHIEIISMKKWAIGMFIGVILTIAALAIPNIINLLT